MNSPSSDSQEASWSSGPWYAREAVIPPAGPGPRRRSRKFVTSVIAGTVALAAAIAAVVVIAAEPGGNGSAAGFAATGSSPEQDGEQITAAFLSAWQDGDLARAAHYTDHPDAAEAALAAYRDDLHLSRLAGSAQSATALASGPATRVLVDFAVTASVAASDRAGTVTGAWSYHGSLTAYQQGSSSSWFIAWAADDLAPNLTASTHLAAVSEPPMITSVTDASAESLPSYGDAGLDAITRTVERKPPAGRAGLYVEIQTASDKPVPGSQAMIVAPADTSLTTTISAAAEQAARSAVAQHRESSIVAIQPSTGHILAIANNDGYNDFALTTAVAPGSTGKIISSTTLLTEGVVTANGPVSCPPVSTVQGISYHNDGGESEPASTPFAYDFAQSCNNALSQWWTDAANGRLAAAARKYYGLDEPWDIGIGESATYYEQPPGAAGSELAENMFGEGAITSTPLAMASVAATVESGTFRQPILVPGARQITATALPPVVDSQLREMMRDVVTEGTAAGLRFGPDVYAKTGTADVNGQGQPNSWFVAFDPRSDVAVACLVVDAGYGAQYAAPEVRHFLSQYQGQR